MKTDGYWNAERAARYLDFVDEATGELKMGAFYDFVADKPVRKYHRGRRLLFKQEDLDAAVSDRDVFVERALSLASGGKR